MKKKTKFTSTAAIRMKCLNCQGFSKMGVRDCEHKNCPNFPYRLGDNPNRKGITNWSMVKNKHGFQKSLIESTKNEQDRVDRVLVLRPLVAIRQECLSCANNQPGEVADCPVIECPHYLFRFGHQPTDEELKQFIANYQEPEMISESYADQAAQIKEIINLIKKITTNHKKYEGTVQKENFPPKKHPAVRAN